MKKAIEEFSRMMATRLSTKEIITTEDSVRYTFFTALLIKLDIKPHEVILEFPHPSLHKRKIDTYIPSKMNRNGLVLEFKYDKYSGLHNLPRPHKAGKLINDLYRILAFKTDPNAKRWFIYLTDHEMATYLSKKSNGLDSFFNLGVGNNMVINKDILKSKSNTFIKAISDINDEEFSIRCIHNEELPNNHKLKIYHAI